MVWHGCRKLAEHGYQRSADKCKEKFEEESRHFNSNMGYTKNYRFFTDLDDELYQDDDHNVNNPHVITSSNEKAQDLGKEKEQVLPEEEEQDNTNVEAQNAVVMTPAVNQPSSHQETVMAKESTRISSSNNKKRKRQHKFEMFKGFCEAVVKRIVAQQEDLHNKLIEGMVRRDEQCIAREEAWKCQEMDRMNKEIETRAQEQAMAEDRQAKIIDLLKKFATSSTSSSSGINSQEDQNLMTKIEDFFKVRKSSTTSVTSSSEILAPNIIETTSSMSNISHHQNPTTSSTTETTPSPQNQYYSPVLAKTSGQSPNQNSHPFSPPSSAQKRAERNEEEEEEENKVLGGAGCKRWPRDEVQALINLKCSHSQTNNIINGDESSKESAGTKGPLWERISQGMMELGYKRSAKRCKEKWENINKYFRKTKDSNKKRSVESRTCPYFHQLSTLYSQGTLVAPPSDVLPPENNPASPAEPPPDQS